MLAVIGILVLLAGLLFPMVVRVRRNADRSRTRGDLNAIASALEAYKADFNDYPRVIQQRTTPTAGLPPTFYYRYRYGAIVLCWALIGPYPGNKPVAGPTNTQALNDWQDGPGFRTVPSIPDPTNPGRFIPQGKVWGPYLAPDKFKLADPFNSNTDPKQHDIGKWCIIDRQDFVGIENSPTTPTWPQWAGILYFPSNPSKPDLHAPVGSTKLSPYVANSELCLYDSADNLDFFVRLGETAPGSAGLPGSISSNERALIRLRMMVGDLSDASGTGLPDGIVNGSEVASAADLPFILWAPGPDGKYGPDLPPAASIQSMSYGEKLKAVRACDDVTNFNINP